MTPGPFSDKQALGNFGGAGKRPGSNQRGPKTPDDMIIGNKKQASSIRAEHSSSAGGEHRNENILCAVLALLKELGDSELELVKRDIERKISSKH